MESWWMHKRLFRDISAELPSQSQLFKDFEQAIPLSPSDKAGHNDSAQELLDVLEVRGQIGLGNYNLLLKLLRETQLIKVLNIAERQIGKIMKQLIIENETSVNLAEKSEEQTKIQNYTQTIQRELQDWYINALSRLRPLSWCDWLDLDLNRVFTNLEMMPGKKDQLCSRSNVDCDDITMFNRLFDTDASKRSVSFVEGPAGIGKSTLCRRLAYSWSKNNYSIGDHSFDILFLLEANSLSRDLKKCMNEQLFPKDFDLSAVTIYDCIRNRRNKCLLIIDGIDELSTEGRTTVMELLKGEKLRHVHLLLTGRPEAFGEFIKYAKSHSKITGFSFENVKEYICKHFDSNENKYKDMLLDRLKYDDELKEIMENPFTTLLVCILVKEDTGDIPANLNDVLNLVLQTLCRNYITKQEGSETFLTEDNLLSAAGHLAYNGLTQGITAYPERTLASFCPDGFSGHLLKSGILSEDFTVSRFDTKAFCYFPHKSFQEFLCAKHLAELDLGEFKETLWTFYLTLNIAMLRFFDRINQCPVRGKLWVEFLLQNINKKSSNPLALIVLEELIKIDQNKDFLAPRIRSHLSPLRFCMFYFSLMTPHSQEFLTEIIKKMKLPPVVIVSDPSIIWPNIDTDKSFGLFELTNRLSFSTGRIMQFPHEVELMIFEPSFLIKKECLYISWPFVRCCSIQEANDLLSKGVKIGILAIPLTPGCDSLKDTTALIKSLPSAKNIASVVFLVVEDLYNGYGDHFLTMVSLLSSLRNVSFLKLRCTRVNRKDVSIGTVDSDGMDNGTEWCHVFKSSITQMFYSKYCPY